MTQTTVRNDTCSSPRKFSTHTEIAHSFIQRMFLCIERLRQRAALAELDDERLRDLGLSRDDVARECAKSFWQ